MFDTDDFKTDKYLLKPPGSYHYASWQYKKIMQQITDFEQELDSNHEIALKLTYFGNSTTMLVTSIGYQNPDLLYFFGYVNGTYSQLIQHISQLNFLITSIEQEDKTKPIRRIGFRNSENSND